MKALKNCLIIFAFLFVLTGIIGYLHGRRDLKEDFIVRAMENISIKDVGGEYYLVYRLRARELYAFDVRKQQLIAYVPTRKDAKTEDGRAPVTGIFMKNADMEKAAGATALTFLLKDIYKTSKMRRAIADNKWAPRWLQLVASAGGVIGGYQAGYWVGSRSNQDEYERLARSELSNAETWKEGQFAFTMWIAMRLKNGIDSLAIEETRTKLHNELARTTEHVESDYKANGVLNPEHLRSLSELEKRVESMLLLGCAPRELFWAYIYPHTMGQWIGVSLALIIIAGYAVYYLLKRAERYT